MKMITLSDLDISKILTNRNIHYIIVDKDEQWHGLGDATFYKDYIFQKTDLTSKTYRLREFRIWDKEEKEWMSGDFDKNCPEVKHDTTHIWSLV